MTQLPLNHTTQHHTNRTARSASATLNREFAGRLGYLVLPVVTVIVASLAIAATVSAMGYNAYLAEMVGGVIINGMGGFMAVAALLIVADKGAVTISRTALLGTTMRMLGVLMGTVVAMGPGWDLQKTPLCYWVLALYFVMLVAECYVAVKLVRAAKH